MSVTESLMDREKKAVHLTEVWLEEVVIGQKFCPFAAYPASKGSIRTVACFETSLLECAFFFKNEVIRLLDSRESELETSLLVLSDTVFSTFDDLLVFIDSMQLFLEENELDSVFQLVAFHPLYQFDGEHLEARSNYTNRSPFPTIHVIREASMAKAIEQFGEEETDRIPQVNISNLESMSDECFKERVLRYCQYRV